MRTAEELHMDMNVWRINQQPKPDPFSEEEALCDITIGEVKEIFWQLWGIHERLKDDQTREEEAFKLTVVMNQLQEAIQD